jgi:hypothetical protein
MINSGIMRMFIFYYNFYIYMFYFVSQVLCICTDNCGYFSMRNIFFFTVMISFFFYLIIWWEIGIETRGFKDGCFNNHDCFYYFLLFCLIILLSFAFGLTLVFIWKCTHTGTLDYFINDNHIKDHVVNVLKDVYFGVWFVIYFYLLIFKYYNLKLLAVIIISQ